MQLSSEQEEEMASRSVLPGHLLLGDGNDDSDDFDRGEILGAPAPPSSSGAMGTRSRRRNKRDKRPVPVAGNKGAIFQREGRIEGNQNIWKFLGFVCNHEVGDTEIEQFFQSKCAERGVGRRRKISRRTRWQNARGKGGGRSEWVKQI